MAVKSDYEIPFLFFFVIVNAEEKKQLVTHLAKATEDCDELKKGEFLVLVTRSHPFSAEC